MRYAKSRNLTPYDLITIASIIERESQLTSDGSKVAAVIYNRLAEGIELGLDTTLLYYLHDPKGGLTGHDLTLETPYNTRNHYGLPPNADREPGSSGAPRGGPAGARQLPVLRRQAERLRSASLLHQSDDVRRGRRQLQRRGQGRSRAPSRPLPGAGEDEEVAPRRGSSRSEPVPAHTPGRLGVLGWPVLHSRSPAMHRAAFAELSLEGWSYQLLPGTTRPVRRDAQGAARRRVRRGERDRATQAGGSGAR